MVQSKYTSPSPKLTSSSGSIYIPAALISRRQPLGGRAPWSTVSDLLYTAGRSIRSVVTRANLTVPLGSEVCGYCVFGSSPVSSPARELEVPVALRCYAGHDFGRDLGG